MPNDFRACEARTTAEAIEALRTYGVAILRGAFDPASVTGLLQRADEHRKLLHKAATEGTTKTLSLPAWYDASPSLACDVTALDPWTAGTSRDFDRTSLWHAMANPLVTSAVEYGVGPDPRWTRARARVVIPDLERGRNGQLGLHLEREAFEYEGIHNLWLPLIGTDEVTNVTTPGLQFFIGNLAFFRSFGDETKEGIYRYLEGIGEQCLSPDPPGNADGFFYRPEMRTGDVALFSGIVPHASYLPSGISQPRIGCDVRIFPNTEANWQAVPQFAQAPLKVA